MQKVNLKYILINGKKINVDMIVDDEEGIKFYYNEQISEGYLKKAPVGTKHLEILQGITVKKKKVTLVDCYYTFRIDNYGKRYFHMKYHYIIYNWVKNENFLCNKLEVSLQRRYCNFLIFDFMNFSKFKLDGIFYTFKYEDNELIIKLISNEVMNRSELYS